MEGSLIGGAVTKAAHRNGIVAHNLGGQRAAGGNPLARAYNAVGAQVVHLLHVGDVHRAALALAVTGLFAKQLRHAEIGVHAPGNGMAVAPVGGSEVVLGLDGGKGTRRGRFLPNAQMNIAGQHTFGEALGGLLLKGPDAHHRAVKISQLFLGVFFVSQCFHAFP